MWEKCEWRGQKNEFVKTPTRWWCVVKIDVLSGICFCYDVCGVNIQYPRGRCGLRRCVDELVLMFVLWKKITLVKLKTPKCLGERVTFLDVLVMFSRCVDQLRMLFGG